MSERRDNSGTLGRNTRREKDTHPTHNGRCVIEGREFWISAWTKEGKDGSKFFSLAFKPKEEQAQQAAPAQADAAFDDDIPFAFAYWTPLGSVLAGLVFAGYVVAQIA